MIMQSRCTPRANKENLLAGWKDSPKRSRWALTGLNAKHMQGDAVLIAQGTGIPALAKLNHQVIL